MGVAPLRAQVVLHRQAVADLRDGHHVPGGGLEDREQAGLAGEAGEVVAVSPIRRQVPVDEYLRAQRRFAHLFGDPPRMDVIAELQARADRNIRRFGLLQEEAA